jgi:signal transduction histidine kinase
VESFVAGMRQRCRRRGQPALMAVKGTPVALAQALSARHPAVATRAIGRGRVVAHAGLMRQAWASLIEDGSGGTGLGPAIGRKIIDIHGGRLWAGNAEVGAVFQIELASARSPAHTMPAPLEKCA